MTLELLRHIQSAYPYWNRTGGRDHVWLFSHDEGACWAPTEVYTTSIILTHWGRLDLDHRSNTAFGEAPRLGSRPEAAVLALDAFNPTGKLPLQRPVCWGPATQSPCQTRLCRVYPKILALDLTPCLLCTAVLPSCSCRQLHTGATGPRKPPH
jgi:hypothetical protein